MKRNANRYKRRLIPLAVFIVGLLIFLLIVSRLAKNEEMMMRDRCALNAQIYADELEKDFNRSSIATDMMAYMIMDEGGMPRNFAKAAAGMMQRSPYIDSIQLAPDGIIADVYPESARIIGKENLFALPDRVQSVTYSRDNKATIIQGPFQLSEGHEGLAVRQPIFFENPDGTERFWGFSIVVLKAPDIFESMANDLKATHNEYRLSKTEPGDDEYHVVLASREYLDRPEAQTFFYGGCYWKLEIMPERGWQPSFPLVLSFFLGLGIVFLLTGMTMLLLKLQERRNHLHRMANTDSLTGLYNRQGFDEAVSKWLRNHPDEKATAVIIDIDNFKLVNDLNSHRAGDEALKNLAHTMQQHFSDVAFVGRNGGDEFCALFRGMPAAEAGPLLDGFATQRHLFRYDGKVHSYTISMGYAEYPTQARSRSSLFQCADAALYAVKLRGKQGMSQYQPHVGEAGRSQLAFGLQDIAMHLPGAILIYKADEQEEILFANLELIHLFDCDTLEEFLTYTNGTFRGIVHPDDYDRVETSIDEQIAASGSVGTDAVVYRILTKKGRLRRVLDKGRLVDTDFYGRIFYVVLLDESSWD